MNVKRQRREFLNNPSTINLARAVSFPNREEPTDE
jgi:hypothetical protein